MTPSVAAASINVAPVATAAPLAVVSTAVHDRERWAVEAVHAGTDWSSLVAAALEMMFAAGIIEEPAAQAMTPWDAPSWCDATVEYHRDRPGRLAVEIELKRLARLRRLMADDISIDRAWHELEADRTAPKATVDALIFSLRRGINELTQPSTLRRLSTLDEYQLEDVCLRVQAFQPRIATIWSAADVDLLISAWRKFREPR
jgi:hypothetical protein